MQVPTKNPNILFITAAEEESIETVSQTGASVSQITWDGQVEALIQRAPDCVLVSDTLEVEQVSELTRAIRRERPAVPVVAFVGDRDEVVDSLFDAGVTDVIRSTVTAATPRLVERRVESAVALARRQRERTLTLLYQATEEFLAAETPQDISEVAVGTATDVLELSAIGIFLFDDDTNLLAPVEGTDTFLEFFGESPVFGPGKEDSITWHTYVTGETQCFTDVQTSDRLAYPDTSARAALLIPLGEHGVFVAASSEAGVFNEQKRQLVGLLAATTEAALDRVTGQADIRERDAALEARGKRLEQLEQLLSVSQDITEVIRASSTRAELEQGLCERLVAYDCLAFAWVGDYSREGDKLEPRAWAGAEDGYLDAVSLEVGGDEAALRAAAGGETVNIPNVTANIRESEWTREAINRGYQSILAVPFTDGDTEYGVVAVYATDPGVFGDSVVDIADEFGSTIVYGINSVETRRGILAEQTTVLEVSLGETDTLLNAVAALVDESVSYQEVSSMGDRTTQIRFTLSDPPVEEILALESEFVGVESLTHTKRRGESLFRATVSGQAIASELLDQGAIPQEITASPHETQVRVTLPAERSVREFLERLRERYPATELRSRQETHREDSPDEIRHALDERLTDRQREVLVSAYENGFFQSPRETTGQELAALLGISQPTLTHHLREAQHRLLTALLTEE